MITRITGVLGAMLSRPNRGLREVGHHLHGPRKHATLLSAFAWVFGNKRPGPV